MPAATDPGLLAWMSEGACLDENPDLFFPVGLEGATLGQIKLAKSICHRCQVKPDCLRFAIRNGIMDGIWGGRTEQERLAMTRDRKHSRRRRRSLRGPRRRPAR